MYYLGGGLYIFHRGGLKKLHIPYPIIYLSEGLSPSQPHIVNPKLKILTRSNIMEQNYNLQSLDRFLKT